jgi:hypothetical protein
METCLYEVYFFLLSQALLWLYLPSYSYFLPLLLYETNSYFLRVLLASTLNKYTRREKNTKKLPVLINWLKTHNLFYGGNRLWSEPHEVFNHVYLQQTA